MPSLDDAALASSDPVASVTTKSNAVIFDSDLTPAIRTSMITHASAASENSGARISAS